MLLHLKTAAFTLEFKIRQFETGEHKSFDQDS